MANISINDLKAAELEELDLPVDSEGYLQNLSEQEENNLYGGDVCVYRGGYVYCGVVIV